MLGIKHVGERRDPAAMLNLGFAGNENEAPVESLPDEIDHRSGKEGFPDVEMVVEGLERRITVGAIGQVVHDDHHSHSWIDVDEERSDLVKAVEDEGVAPCCYCSKKGPLGKGKGGFKEQAAARCDLSQVIL